MTDTCRCNDALVNLLKTYLQGRSREEVQAILQQAVPQFKILVVQSSRN